MRQDNITRQVRNAAARALVLALALSFATGCAVRGDSERTLPVSMDERAVAVPDAVQDLLSREPAGARVRFSESPWGADLAAELDAIYVAASGRTCRRVTLVSSDAPRPVLVCRGADGLWHNVRVLHDHGRPVLPERSLERHARSEP
jgi:hypothetical protein